MRDEMHDERHDEMHLFAASALKLARILIIGYHHLIPTYAVRPKELAENNGPRTHGALPRTRSRRLTSMAVALLRLERNRHSELYDPLLETVSKPEVQGGVDS